MKPVSFECQRTFSITPEQICAQVFDVARWTSFRGHGPIPGIARAEYGNERREGVGTTFRVTNEDGSSHVEEVVDYEPGRRLRMELREFSAPLKFLATRFEESWHFERAGERTEVTRRFELFPRSVLTRLPLVLIARLLRRAVAAHLEQMET